MQILDLFQLGQRWSTWTNWPVARRFAMTFFLVALCSVSGLVGADIQEHHDFQILDHLRYQVDAVRLHAFDPAQQARHDKDLLDQLRSRLDERLDQQEASELVARLVASNLGVESITFSRDSFTATGRAGDAKSLRNAWAQLAALGDVVYFAHRDSYAAEHVGSLLRYKFKSVARSEPLPFTPTPAATPNGALSVPECCTQAVH